MQAIFVALYIFLFTAIIWRAKIFDIGVDKRLLLGSFWLKVGAAFCLWAVYEFYYNSRSSSDIFRFFDDAQLLYSHLSAHPKWYFEILFGGDPFAEKYDGLFDGLNTWSHRYRYGLANDNQTVVRVHMLIALFSHGYFHVHAVFFAFLSWLGLIGFFKAFQRFCSNKKQQLVLFGLLFLLPTVLFWSSAPLKEALLIFGMGSFMYFFFSLIVPTKPASLSAKILHLVLGIFFGVLLIYIKPYVLFCLVAPLLSFAICSRVWPKFYLLIFLFVHTMVLALSAFAHLFYPAGNLPYILRKKRTDFLNLAQEKNAGSLVDLPPMENWFDIFVHAPQAIWHTYARPSFWEAKGILYWTAALENLLFFALVILLAFNWKKLHRKEVLFCVSFAIGLGVIIGYTVPVLGASVRYKMPGWLLLCVAGILLLKNDRNITIT